MISAFPRFSQQVQCFGALAGQNQNAAVAEATKQTQKSLLLIISTKEIHKNNAFGVRRLFSELSKGARIFSEPALRIHEVILGMQHLMLGMAYHLL